MTKWEYKKVVRSRRFRPAEGNLPWFADNWDTDIDSMLERLGEEGWELIAVSASSNVLGGVHRVEGKIVSASGNLPSINFDYAGFTSHETWVFKRPKSE